VHPVHREIALLGLGRLDELTAEAGSGGLGRPDDRVGDGGVGDNSIGETLAFHQIVEAAVRCYVVVREVDQGEFRMTQRHVPFLLIPLDEVILHHPVDLPVQGEWILLEAGQQVLPHLDRTLHCGRETGIPGVPQGPVEVFPLNVERRQLASVGEPHLAPTRRIVADLTNGPDRVVEREVAEHHVRLEHLEQRGRGTNLHVCRVFAHVRVTRDHVEAPVTFGIGVRLIPRVDDRSGSSRSRRHALPNVLRPLGDTEHGATRRLEQLAGTAEDLAGHQERNEGLHGALKIAMAANQEVLVASVRVPSGVGVVLEEVDLAPDPFLFQPLLSRAKQALQHTFARFVVGDQVIEVVALWRRVFRMAPHVEVEPGTVFEEHVRRAPPAHNSPEEIPGDLVGTEAPLPAKCARHSVFVLDPEDSPLHRARLPPSSRNTA